MTIFETDFLACSFWRRVFFFDIKTFPHLIFTIFLEIWQLFLEVFKQANMRLLTIWHMGQNWQLFKSDFFALWPMSGLVCQNNPWFFWFFHTGLLFSDFFQSKPQNGQLFCVFSVNFECKYGLLLHDGATFRASVFSIPILLSNGKPYSTFWTLYSTFLNSLQQSLIYRKVGSSSWRDTI